jgi:carboxypeptidase PM20D1
MSTESMTAAGERIERSKASGGHRPARAWVKMLASMVILAAMVLGAMIVRTLQSKPIPHGAEMVSQIAIPQGAAERLAGAIRISTISHEDPASFDAQAFQALHTYLQASFPRVHSELRREVVSRHSLLYTWQGSDSSLRPILLMGHQDVVPVEPGTESGWEQQPFSGMVADGFIWGRGAIDNKSTVVGTLEAMEMLLAEGFRPARTVYLAYGHDEEVGGAHGAKEIAALLRSRGVKLEMVLDEGGVIGDGVMAGISAPTALVGIAEKGFVTVELSTRASGGHSSLPPRQSAVGIVSKAVAQLEQNPMPARLEKPTQQLFERIGPHFPFAQRAVFANLWATRPLVMGKLQESATTNAMIRTTAAATIFQAGTKDNVLPSHARAVINFRILTGDSVAGVLNHVVRIVDDPRVEVKAAGRFSAEPSAVSSTESQSFKAIERTIGNVMPEAIVAPYLVVVVTDARYYEDLSANVFRFLPIRLAQSDLARMHGSNERIAIRDYERAIRFYRQLVLNTAS